MTRSENEALAAEAAYFEELQRRRDAGWAAAADQAGHEHPAPSGAELQRQTERAIQGLQDRIDFLQRQLYQQVQNHHELCKAMHTVLQHLKLEEPEEEEEEEDRPF